MNSKKIFHKSLEPKSEEISDIIEKMPTNFGYYISGFVFFIVSIFLFFGFIIKYPDVQVGKITLTTQKAPLKMIANKNGELILLKKNNDFVKTSEIIALLKNTTDLSEALKLEQQLKKFHFQTQLSFPKFSNLGELTPSYLTFKNALNQYQNYLKLLPFDKQTEIQNKLLNTQNKINSLQVKEYKLVTNKKNISNQLFKRDSILFLEQINSKQNLQQSSISKQNSEQEFVSGRKQLTQNEYQLEEIKNHIQEIKINKFQKEYELTTQLLNTYIDLTEQVKLWKQNHLFVAQQDGILNYLNFFRSNDYVFQNQEIFKIIPKNNKLIGQVYLPEIGAGKVRENQEVNIKLDNYPYLQFGSIKGKVKGISKAKNESLSAKENTSSDQYLVWIDLPNGLKTNYNSELTFHQESKGIAEIITDKRSFITRLFSNLTYHLKN